MGTFWVPIPVNWYEIRSGYGPDCILFEKIKEILLIKWEDPQPPNPLPHPLTPLWIRQLIISKNFTS